MAKKRWTYLRDYYVKTKNKKTPSGSASTEGEASSWAYYGIMSFLDGSLEPRKGCVQALMSNQLENRCRRVSSLKSQQPVPAPSQVDLFEDEDLDNSFGDSPKDTASLNGPCNVQSG